MIDPIVKRCAGLDVHKMKVTVTVLIEQEDGSVEEETREYKTFRNHRRQLARWLKRLGIELAVMESTGNYWRSIHDTLDAEDIAVWVVNARHVKQVPGRKTDVVDSRWLAILGRMGLIRPSFVPSKDFRELRLITRQRQKLMASLSAEKNRLHKVLDDAGIRLGGVVSDINGVSSQAMIAGLIDGKPPSELVTYAKGRLKKKTPELLEALDEPLSERHRMLLRTIQEHIRYLESQIQALDEYLFSQLTPYHRQWEILQTLPGMDRVSAAILLVELGTDMRRFGGSANLASWAGLCPGNNESAGKRKSGRTRKGNRAVRRVLCEAANAASKTNSQFKGKYQSLVIRRGHKRTIIAVAHKMLRVVYSMLKNDRPYYDPAVDYEALMVQKNAPRWIKALEKYGYLPQLAAA
jgi:transposase